MRVVGLPRAFYHIARHPPLVVSPKAQERLAAVDGQLEDLRGRLYKLYNALETGELEVEELAPRIKELKAQIDDLETRRLDLAESIRDTRVELVEASVVKAYVDDLKGLLSQGSILEQRSFLRSFVKRIEVNLPEGVLDYTIPLETKRIEPLTREVLPFAPLGFGQGANYGLTFGSVHMLMPQICVAPLRAAPG